jgi:REP element-mobilizing transposase RayT
MKAAFKYEVLEPEGTYHIYNHANGSEKIFRRTADYDYFLQQYTLYIAPIADTYCFCLMPNHFHMLVRIKPEDELIRFFEGLFGLRRMRAARQLAAAAGPGASAEGIQQHLRRLPTAFDVWPLEKHLSKQFSNLFSAYTQSLNKRTGRMGSMFMKNFKRKKIGDMNYLHTLVKYIHRNPVDAGLCAAVEEWPYSSYRYICRADSWFVDAKEVISWYDDVENFKFAHERE